MWRTIKFNKDGSPLWDANDQGVIYSYRAKRLIGTKNREENPYYAISDEGTKVYVHQLIAQAFPEICGKWFEGAEVHHKDKNTLNNAATNLIVCTKEQHSEFHRLIKQEEENERFKKYLKEKKKLDKEKRKKEKLKRNDSLIKKIEELNKTNKLIIHYYCRESKVNKDGLSPIEISISIEGKKNRNIYTTNFFSNPKDFRKKKYPKEFKKFINKINSIVL